MKLGIWQVELYPSPPGKAAGGGMVFVHIDARKISDFKCGRSRA